MGLDLNGIGLNGYWPNWELDQVALDEMALDEMGLDEVAISQEKLTMSLHSRHDYQNTVTVVTRTNSTCRIAPVILRKNYQQCPQIALISLLPSRTRTFSLSRPHYTPSSRPYSSTSDITQKLF